MKKDVYYFPHFCHSRSDNKMRRIMKDFKHEGYSVFYQVLEILREQEGFKYPLEDCDLLVDDLKTTDIVLNSLIHNYGLFENDTVYFWSNELIESLQPFIRMKQQRIDAAQKSVESRKRKYLILNETQTTVERPLNDRETEVETPVEQSKVKKRKVNESKEKESKKDSSFFVLISSKVGRSEKLDFDTFKEKFKAKEEAILISQRRTNKNFTVDAFNKILNQFFVDKTLITFESQNHFFHTLSIYVNANSVNTVNKITVKDEDQFGYA